MLTYGYDSKKWFGRFSLGSLLKKLDISLLLSPCREVPLETRVENKQIKPSLASGPTIRVCVQSGNR